MMAKTNSRIWSGAVKSVDNMVVTDLEDIVNPSAVVVHFSCELEIAGLAFLQKLSMAKVVGTR